MRTLKFVVNGQNIELDPNCDFTGLVPGTNGYLEAKFSFSSEWNGCAKVAAFFSSLGREFTPQVINGTTCVIPPEALEKSVFKVQVIGQKENYNIRTNRVIVRQRGGKV